MKKTAQSPYLIHSISELHRLLGLPTPAHPLVSVIDLGQTMCFPEEVMKSYMYNFYSVCIKKDFRGKMKYGQHYYDFDHGVMTFFSPGQVLSTITEEDRSCVGWWLVFHPDYIRHSTLGQKLKTYGYFSYAVNEALHVSEREEVLITNLMQQIDQEYRSIIDGFSQDVIISHIELLLNYCNRFYNRQFITRKSASNDLLVKLETMLDDYFDGDKVQELGLPTVQYVSEQLAISPNYLSDMLRSLTGQNTQQHIHNKLIEKAQQILTTTSLSVSEIAYQLGFEYPQSFSKLFKNKMNISPLEFRQSFN
ncbi:helix-turn-helix domain-containing protein [Larkinella insperata]|uniref:Helix-turn-helix domain-containing protein n=1 Tax=Larkinella insperata TaxID=332158 RepID=A0ABW3Q3J1_9BACT|nr:AraC family transcriptional regulator [Larkinella insperata]